MKQRENKIESKPTFNNDSKTSKNEKNVFDKKKHRLKKYSNKYKGKKVELRFVAIGDRKLFLG